MDEELTVDLAELTRRIGIEEDRQAEVLAWIPAEEGTMWSEVEARRFVRRWHREH